MTRVKTAIVVLIALVTMLPFSICSSSAESEESLIEKKARALKKIFRHGALPSRHVSGALKTGQMTSYTPGDDGDLKRGVQWPEPRFIDHDDGTVTDKLTGLMWIKAPQRITPKADWFKAIESCNELAFAGYDDWRMPNLRELHSLIDFGNHHPALPPQHPFVIAEKPIVYWTGTTSVPDIARAWNVNMSTGGLNRYNKSTQLLHVWPVRTGWTHAW